MLVVILYILAFILLILFVVVVYAVTKPNEFSIVRAIEIATPPERIFPLVADFRNWSLWSPWEKMDPSQKRTLSGAEFGKGAIYEWEGNNKVGSGRMEILEANPSSRVVIKLSFFKPFAAENRAIFDFLPTSSGTNVTWEMTGTKNLMFKVMGLFMNMDDMVGRDFEKGLAAMKTEAESGGNLA